MTRKKLGLVKGRHVMPVTQYVFEEVKDTMNFRSMQDEVRTKLKEVDRLDLYVTGLTSALVEVINYCIYNNVALTLFHYDWKNEKYVPQKMATGNFLRRIQEGER